MTWTVKHGETLRHLMILRKDRSNKIVVFVVVLVVVDGFVVVVVVILIL